MKTSRSPSIPAKKPSAAQAARIAVIMAIGAFGVWQSYGLAVSGVTRGKLPDAALRYTPHDSRALAAKSEQLLFRNLKSPPQEAQSLARTALQQQILNPLALRNLGYYSEASGNRAKAFSYMRASERLSRRDAGAQIWLLDYYARTGDAKQALQHYDILLRTNPASQDILFPRLMGALSDPAIRSALAHYIKNSSVWGNSFLYYANANSKDLSPLVKLRLEMGTLPDKKMDLATKIELLSRLTSANHFDESYALFRTIEGAQNYNLESARITVADVNRNFGSMGWQALDTDDAGADFQLHGNVPVLAIYANPNTTRHIARKILYLKPGSYNFSVRYADTPSANGGYLRWEIKCPTIESSPTRWSLQSENTASRSNFVIPANCPVQLLDLIVSGGQGREGIEATVTSVSID